MIQTDSPIENKSWDKLNRVPLANKVAEAISSAKKKDSFVIGVESPWGAGKTSFINIVLEELEKDGKYIVVKFNPWNFIDQNQLINDFFLSIMKKIEPFLEKSTLKNLKSYASKLEKVSFEPKFKLWGAEFSLGKLSKDKKTIQEERDSINKALDKLNKKIVVVIDDIDRLDKEETRLIMKLVKMTANFPNTVFLLAYDRERVAERLSEDGWPGEEYLKKIIQVPFTLPEPDRLVLNRILTDDLNETILNLYGQAELNKADSEYWESIKNANFFELFSTVRDIKRYISSLSLNWSIIGVHEINPIDFIVIEAIKLFAPVFYSSILDNRDLFISGHVPIGQLSVVK